METAGHRVIQERGNAGALLDRLFQKVMAAVQRMNTRSFLALASVLTLAACGGGGSGSTAPAAAGPQPAVVAPPGNTSPAPTTNAADSALADRLYKGTARTPDGFDVETRPANVTGTLATRHIKNTDFATGPQALGNSYEICTNDMAQALEWSERLAGWQGQYSDLVEIRSDARLFEVVRVPRADVTAMLRHRVFRCDYLDRSSSDLRTEAGAAGNMNQRPLTAAELERLAEYLWQFTPFNNSDYVVQSSSATQSGASVVHTIRMGKLVRGAVGACDTVEISDWTHTMNPTDGTLTRALTPVRSFKARSSNGGVEFCE